MQAIILAGGASDRLRPYVEDIPPSMIEVLGVPVLGYQLRWLQSQSITNIIVACGYRHEVIKEYFGTGEKWRVSITYEVEENSLGSGGALKRAFRHVSTGEDACLATNGDVLTNVRIKPLVQAHRAGGCSATVVLVPLISPYGIVDVDETDSVTSFQEKPELPYWMNAGIYVFNRDVETLLPDQGNLEDSTFPQLAREQRLAAFKSRAYWRSVDTVKDLSEVTKELEKRLMTSFLA